MLFRLFKLFVASLLSVAFLVACGGGSSAPTPTKLTVTPGEGYATVTWDMTAGVEYWLFYAPTSNVPADSTETHKWIGLLGGASPINVSSPYVASGLVNGTSYSFTINGRTDGGPGGPGAPAVTATPRLAGASWIKGTNAGSAALRSVAFGSTTASVATYVTAGDGGALYSSTDGLTWTTQNSGTSNQLNGATYFGRYTVVGDNGLLLTSSDAVTWTAQPTAATASAALNLNAVASNKVNLTVAVGAGGTIITSSDGVTWTKATSSGTSSDLYAVTYSTYNVGTNTAGTWLAVGAAGTIVQSADGVNWTAVNLGSVTTASLRGIAYGASSATAAGVFVAVSADGTVLSSANGSTWSAVTLPAAVSSLHALSYGTQFVTAGADGSVFTSTDGVIWNKTNANTASTNPIYAVARGTLAYVAVGAQGSNLLAK